MLNKVTEWWCRHFHDAIYWPVRGRYRCAKCLRTWDVPWEQTRQEQAAGTVLLAQQHLAR
jgi:hypothetical protein